MAGGTGSDDSSKLERKLPKIYLFLKKIGAIIINTEDEIKEYKEYPRTKLDREEKIYLFLSKIGAITIPEDEIKEHYEARRYNLSRKAY